jgi:hypothetical protein
MGVATTVIIIAAMDMINGNLPIIAATQMFARQT